MRGIFVLTFVLILTACSATTNKVASRDDTSGLSQEFFAPYETVVAAAKTALESQKLKIKETTPAGDTTIYLFEKPVSAFSWGESGRIVVRKVDDARSQAFLTSAKNVAVNVTAKSERTFAKEIFGEMSRILAGG